MKLIVGLFIVIVCVIFGCNSREKTEELRRQQQRLNERELQLVMKENELKLKEEDLARREKDIDSIEIKDSVIQAELPEIAGTWQVTMTCTETNCQGSAIGDTKTEQWHISYRDNHVLAEAYANNKLARIYSGGVNQNTIELIEHRDSLSMTYDTRMVVRLNIKDKKNMDGRREIIRQNDCKIVYSLSLNKQ